MELTEKMVRDVAKAGGIDPDPLTVLNGLTWFEIISAVLDAALKASWKPVAEKCREHGDSFHVEYTVDDEGNEKKNLTQARSIDTDAIAEREQTEYGWIIEEGTAHEKPGRVRVTAGDFGETHLGYDLEQTISAKTAEQLSDAFARAAVLARQEEQKAKAARAEARAVPETGSLFDEGPATENK